MFLLLSLILAYIIYYVVSFYFKVRKYPNGPFPLPVIGNIHQIDMKTFHRQLDDFSKQYGSIFTVWLPEPHIFVCDYDHMKEVFVKQGDVTSGRGKSLPERLFLPYENPGIIASDGDKWLHQRRTAISIFRDLGMGKNRMNEIVTLSICEAMDSMKSLDKDQLKAFNPTDLIQLFVGQVVNKLLFGIVYSANNSDHLRHMMNIIHKQSLLSRTSSTIGLLTAFPWLERIPIVGSLITREFLVYPQELVDSVEKDIRKSLKDYDPSVEPECFVQYYYQKMQTDPELSEQFLKEVASDFFLAGMDTTSVTIQWALLYLAKHPHVQTKIRNEIEASIGNRLPTISDRPLLPYTIAAITEIQRCASIVPINVIHRNTEEINLSGHRIPVNSRLIPQIGILMNSSPVFEKPSEFRPERFLQEDGKTMKKTTTEQVLPFSLGKRQCAGEGLARLEIFLAVVIFVQNYLIEPCDGKQIDLSAEFSFILQPNSQELKFTPVS